jgi:hypothetical protein
MTRDNHDRRMIGHVTSSNRFRKMFLNHQLSCNLFIIRFILVSGSSVCISVFDTPLESISGGMVNTTEPVDCILLTRRN